MTRYYVDTNIWLDLLESRSSSLKPFGEFAFQFFKKCLDRKNCVLYSQIVLDELTLRHSLEDVEKHCFGLFQRTNLLEFVPAAEWQKNEAVRIALSRGVSKSDAVHAILARDNNAVVITRDKHFNLLQDIAKSLTPEEVC